MKNMNTYLIFNGNCREAIEFYHGIFGGALFMSKYSEMPGGCGDLPKGYHDWLMHARITIKNLVLMASDARPGMPVQQGNNFFVSIQCESIEEVEKLFKALGKNGSVEMAPQETFWAIRFGMLTDQFGIKWMFNFEKPM